jgi:predicted acetyltransferase
MDLEIRPVTADEVPAFCRAEELAFGVQLDPEDLGWFAAMIEPERSLAVFDQGRIVATAGALSMELTVPGSRSLPMAGVSWVGVHPTHRRRGLLRAMMRRQLDDLHAGSQVLAGLTASESLLYGRFGYGLAVTAQMLRIGSRHGAFGWPVVDGGRMVMLDAAEAAKLLPGLQESIRLGQVGDNRRPASFWDATFLDPTSLREGRSARFYAVHESAEGEPDGFVVWRTSAQWVDGDGHDLWVEELRASSSEVEAALWCFVLGIDLVRTVTAVWRPVDDPLRWRLADPRRLEVEESADVLWLRLVDVAAALERRAYAVDDDLVLDVADPFCPWNARRHRLEAGPDGAACGDAPPGRAADLALSEAELAATYLGGVSFSTLARAGRLVEHTPGALRRADALFATERQPWCTTDF